MIWLVLPPDGEPRIQLMSVKGMRRSILASEKKAKELVKEGGLRDYRVLSLKSYIEGKILEAMDSFIGTFKEDEDAIYYRLKIPKTEYNKLKENSNGATRN